ncbi:MAG: DUF3127 domain-containing protein [Rikenellaceae bacterium]|nr:DUF3127 domain-containing protein [Rikenellaceae bacterium]
MEIEATVVKLLPVVKGTSARGEWTKQEVILEQPGEFGRKLCVSFWGDKALDAAILKEGETITVSLNLESREFNGRWYTEARVWKMTKAAPGPGTPFAPPTVDFPPLPPEDAAGTTGEDTFDDLPF